MPGIGLGSGVTKGYTCLTHQQFHDLVDSRWPADGTTGVTDLNSLAMDGTLLSEGASYAAPALYKLTASLGAATPDATVLRQAGKNTIINFACFEAHGIFQRFNVADISGLTIGNGVMMADKEIPTDNSAWASLRFAVNSGSADNIIKFAYLDVRNRDYNTVYTLSKLSSSASRSGTTITALYADTSSLDTTTWYAVTGCSDATLNETLMKLTTVTVNTSVVWTSSVSGAAAGVTGCTIGRGKGSRWGIYLSYIPTAATFAGSRSNPNLIFDHITFNCFDAPGSSRIQGMYVLGSLANPYQWLEVKNSKVSNDATANTCKGLTGLYVAGDINVHDNTALLTDVTCSGCTRATGFEADASTVDSFNTAATNFSGNVGIVGKGDLVRVRNHTNFNVSGNAALGVRTSEFGAFHFGPLDTSTTYTAPSSVLSGNFCEMGDTSAICFRGNNSNGEYVRNNLAVGSLGTFFYHSRSSSYTSFDNHVWTNTFPTNAVINTTVAGSYTTHVCGNSTYVSSGTAPTAETGC